MLSNVTNSLQLLEVAQRELLYKKLLLQIKKDFGLANVGLNISMDISPVQLKEMLHEKIYFLLVERFQDYLNLLYVVDIPEREVKKIAPTDAVDISAEVSFLILKREWQKVWFKSQYSG